MRGGYRTFVAIGALSAIAIGTQFYDPDGYVAVARPICGGFTANGCRLRWQEVPTEDGTLEAQCVQYCPRPASAPRPVQVIDVPPEPEPAPVAAVAPPAALTPPPAPAGCELVVFNQRNFAGNQATVYEDESALSDDWDRQISSVQVKAGNWDLFTEPEFGGNTMRLTPGDYAALDAQWDKQIGSMMCTEPGQ